MLVILSGEGPSDLGSKNDSTFQKGPMCYILDALFKEIDVTPSYNYISEGELAYLKKKYKRYFLGKKGVKKGQRDLFISAKVLALYTIEHYAMDSAVILFRDSDGTRSAPESLWKEKWNAITSGFKAAPFNNGIPMLPRPKSEAWLLGYYQKEFKGQTEYNACERFENFSGNDNSDSSLKKLLSKAFGGIDNPYEAITQTDIMTIDWNRIDMPSFNAFKERFNEVFQG